MSWESDPYVVTADNRTAHVGDTVYAAFGDALGPMTVTAIDPDGVLTVRCADGTTRLRTRLYVSTRPMIAGEVS